MILFFISLGTCSHRLPIFFFLVDCLWQAQLENDLGFSFWRKSNFLHRASVTFVQRMGQRTLWKNPKSEPQNPVSGFILLHEKFLQFDWLRAVVFQLNLKYLHVKITNLQTYKITNLLLVVWWVVV